jgi:hypothetical protein
LDARSRRNGYEDKVREMPEIVTSAWGLKLHTLAAPRTAPTSAGLMARAFIHLARQCWTTRSDFPAQQGKRIFDAVAERITPPASRTIVRLLDGQGRLLVDARALE